MLGPMGIEIKWLKNRQEQTAWVVSTELLQNEDWTFQILVMLEMSLRRGDVYTCQVKHISPQDPLTVHWVAQSDSARSKMLTGVRDFVLGLTFLAAGLLTCPRLRKEVFQRPRNFLPLSQPMPKKCGANPSPWFLNQTIQSEGLVTQVTASIRHPLTDTPSGEENTLDRVLPMGTFCFCAGCVNGSE
ncbi:HLA class II histocompatibility antigen, DQ beta 2 chain-like [Gopherus flavomarginatus]|uniref:HLA class II histocompatibility antigen, DQ beta 2 chain-like n=1 Tax=Gopherus flavomarginatus TaxID=286002 RepID=UPI0021CC4B8F|nr:HLA class II histocompatibility antigen, DQ beta 2 chain-like [Gopherus flavomarginatus]